jgi:tetratricopeptide (TPR) repeat protein
MSRKTKRSAASDKTGVEAARRTVAIESPAAYSRGDAALFGLTLFLSAALLFTVQPMFAKMVLPRLGGAPAVWNACLVFYQAVLLGGYLYAHLSLKWLGPRRQAVLQLGLLAMAWISLPVHIADRWLPPATAFPAPWLWMLLAVALGLPFLALSAHAPMLQAWFSRTHRREASDPYFLYAASNVGSLLGLLGYPLLMEARLTLGAQSLMWAVGFGLLMAMIAACAARLWRAGAGANVAESLEDFRLKTLLQAPAATPSERDADITVARRLRWLALSLVPSSLMMGVTTYITSEITQMSVLEVIPLALYLVTFVFVFARKTVLPLKWMLRLQPVLIVVAAASLMLNVAGVREMLLLGSLHLAVFFVSVMVCHGQLAADRPAPARLTEFYLWMSLGGVLGGLLNALVAPLIFNSALEYPLMMVAACMLRPQCRMDLRVRPVIPGRTRRSILQTPEGGRPHPERARYFERRDLLSIAVVLLCLAVAWGLRSDSFTSIMHLSSGFLTRLAVLGLAAVAALLLSRRPIVFGLAVGAVAAIGLWSVQSDLQVLDSSRSFFGILRVDYDALWNIHRLYHGTTSHGVQSLYADERREPQGYFHRTGPLGEIFAALAPRRPLTEVGILGLGAGTIAAYAERGERFTFYEIDPAVERIAKNWEYSTYLSDCRGKTEVVLGDARQSLMHGPQRQFDLMVLDVFSSDAVPLHLMTRDAMQLYLSRLNPHGVLAFHISSRYFNLEPVLGRLAAEAGLTARIWRDNENSGNRMVGRYPSTWVAMARHPRDLGDLAAIAHWRELACDPGPVWTDEFSNLVATLHWQATGLNLTPMRWTQSGKAKRAADHAAIARNMLQEGRIEDAVDQLRKSLALAPDKPLEHRGLAAALAALGRTEEAADEYAKSLMLDNRSAPCHRGLGVALGRMGKLDDAMREFKSAIALDPSDVQSMIDLGDILLDRKELDEAAKCYRQGIAVKPDSADLHYALGNVLEQQGKVRHGALDEFRRALSLAEKAGNPVLAEKIKVAIRRCEAWPWDEGKK